MDYSALHWPLSHTPFLVSQVEVDLIKGEQLSTEYQHVCPNKKVPAIAFVDVPVSMSLYSCSTCTG